MSPDQVARMLDVLDKIAEGMSHQQYTLTGASDWPLLVFLFGLGSTLVGVLFGIIVYNVKDLKTYIKDNDSGVRILLDKEEIERKHQDDLLWVETRRMISVSEKEHEGIKQDMIRCKEKCCEGVK